MPILAYFVVMGPMLLGLLYFAEARLGPPSSLAISTEFHGLPAPFKAKDAVQILTVRETPRPEIAENAFAKSVVQPPLEPRKHTKHAAAPKKKKIAKVRPQGPRNLFAQSARREYGTVW